MLAFSSAVCAFSTPSLPVRSAIGRATAPAMRQSEALPFLEAPAHCDGTYIGDVGFDPLNIGGMYNIKYMREAELKHGRICQLAFLGYLTTDSGIWAPGAPHVSSLQAHDATVKTGHMLFLLFVVGVFEALSYNAINQMLSGETDREPGDYGIGWKFCKPGDTKTQERYRLAEITHCRAAMLGFSGMVTASALTEGPLPYIDGAKLGLGGSLFGLAN